jgi:hypothetical protein
MGFPFTLLVCTGSSVHSNELPEKYGFCAGRIRLEGSYAISMGFSRQKGLKTGIDIA